MNCVRYLNFENACVLKMLACLWIVVLVEPCTCQIRNVKSFVNATKNNKNIVN